MEEATVDKSIEARLEKCAAHYLRKARPGDYEHTLRVVGYGKELLKNEEGDENVVIPTLYLHDIGWSQVDYSDFIDAPSPEEKYATKSTALHMKLGAALAKKILEKLDYDSKLIRDIVTIIGIHDDPQAIRDLNNPSATLIFEADSLDKIGPESSRRIRKMFGSQFYEMDLEAARSFIQRGMKEWFQTKSAKRMALDLMNGSAVFELLEEDRSS